MSIRSKIIWKLLNYNAMKKCFWTILVARTLVLAVEFKYTDPR